MNLPCWMTGHRTVVWDGQGKVGSVLLYWRRCRCGKKTTVKGRLA